jgi:hypothetical protein
VHGFVKNFSGFLQLLANPIDPSRRVSDTHLPPTFRPEYVITESGERHPYDLIQLGQLVQNPRTKKMRSQFVGGASCLVEHLADELPREPAAWLVQRRGVIGRNHDFNVLRERLLNDFPSAVAGYAAAPSVVDLATVVFARHVTTGERHLGDGTGAEGCRTYSFTAMYVTTPFDFGTGPSYRLVFGSFAPRGLTTNGGVDYYGTLGRDAQIGLALLRVFLVPGPARASSGQGQ